MAEARTTAHKFHKVVFVSELDRARAMVERCAEKRDQAGDAESFWYYEQCRRGWAHWVQRLESGEAP